MQFHLDGFQPGDPDRHPAADQGAGPDGLPTDCDVLIVGCGPAGLTLAAQLAAFPAIKTCIVDQKPGPLEKGQADGIACRTVEMFQAFGFAHRVLNEAYWVNETVFWTPSPDAPHHIHRSGRIYDTEDGLSEFPHVILNQARVHDMYLDVMANAPTRLVPVYGQKLTGLSGIDADGSVTASFEPADSGPPQDIKARFVVGCDGARSGVRQALGLDLQGEAANQAWGVMDVLALTDFPDIRLKSVVRSSQEGSALIIPREGGYLVRFYIELDKLKPGERVSAKELTQDHLIAAAQRIFAPFSIDVKDVVWWSVYEIGQRLCRKFDNVPAGQEAHQIPRVFIAGDACHTHSPKAGQGMNVSMQDSFNLGWKLAAVLQGQAPESLLHSYSSERQAVARDLIDFDRKWATTLSARTGDADADALKVQEHFIAHGRYTAGTSVRYAPSKLTGQDTHQALAHGFQIGTRFHSAPVTRLADGKPLQLGHTVTADGRWRIFAFGDMSDPADHGSAIQRLCTYLANDPGSPIRRFTPPADPLDARIDVRAVFQQPHRDLDVAAMPAFLKPHKGRFGLQDAEKMFCPDTRVGPDIFALRHIDRTRGCMVIVRPDQYVAHVLPLDGHQPLSRFFEGVMLPPE